MKIAIQHKDRSFNKRWIEYCESNGIEWKPVDCYRNDIINQLQDCDALMWHINQASTKDILFAKQLIHSVESTGKLVFPDIRTSWHFDDKVGQKYLLESIGAPMVPSWIFYDKKDALRWISRTSFPKVFKLRGGAGSQNVHLVRSRTKARRLTHKAFRRGFSHYEPWSNLRDRWRMFQSRKTNFFDLIKGVIRFIFPPKYARMGSREKGYIYFQEFLEDNSFDIRIIVIGDKAFAIKRLVRKNDFRASGSGRIKYEKEHFPDETVNLAFQLAEKLKTQCGAFDFIYSGGKAFVVEISFGFIKEVYDPCTGYWDRHLNWHEGAFNPYGWMVENLIEQASG